MNAINRVSLIALLSYCIGATAAAAESKPSLDSILAKWEAATAKIKTLDAKIYRRQYDSIFGSPNTKPESEEGRFYYEGPKSGCLQIKSKDGEGWHGLSSMFVWRENELLMIDGPCCTCEKYVLPVARSRDSNPNDSFICLLRNAFDSLRSPRNYLPFTVDVHVAEFKNDWELSLTDQRDPFLITARRKKTNSGFQYSRIDVRVDGKTYLTTAIRCFTPNGTDYIEWKFEDVKYNERPRDRERLLSPDLHGIELHIGRLQAIEYLWSGSLE
jgi:hypothetical protein